MIENKENVGGGQFLTGAGAEAQTTEKRDQTEKKEASTVWEKFKDADALAKAYGSLQAEFTRRSQRLKELERQVENLKAEEEKSRVGGGVEKLRKKADERRAEERRFESFVSELERANVSACEGENSDVERPEGLERRAENDREGEGVLEKNAEEQTQENAAVAVQEKAKSEEDRGEQKNPKTGDTVRESVATEQNTADDSERLYQRATEDENVRLRIIGEYLSSIGKTGAPLMRGGTGTFATPPLRAKSIAEAGSMALRFFRKES